MPVVFVGHGNPMNAIEDSEFSHAWEAAAGEWPRPAAVLCISAHWQVPGARMTAQERPRTIHDFYGFPPELYAVEYPAPGSGALVERVRALARGLGVQPDQEWGLDHGCWSVLRRMCPRADVPVVQFNLNANEDAGWHYRLGSALRPLRDENVLILGSGNLVHNLMMVQWEGGAYDWARRFDRTVTELVSRGDHASLVDYEQLGKDAELAIPTNEHYLPLICALGAAHPGEPATFFARKVTMGSISMTCVRLG
jgi:4,5-DOPA dioxygenase extradiol